tara:strand:- start:2394 stop:2714 length:321 start_codon:yes stop_codon:yes gene_type:complete
MEKKVKFNYEDLLKDYEHSIENKLRGFRQSFEMLDLWVPDEDHEKSILNLIESVQISGIQKFSIALNDNILEKIDIEALHKTLSLFVNLEFVDSDNGMEIKILGIL